jgi:hypothetical protein
MHDRSQLEDFSMVNPHLHRGAKRSLGKMHVARSAARLAQGSNTTVTR